MFVATGHPRLGRKNQSKSKQNVCDVWNIDFEKDFFRNEDGRRWLIDSLLFVGMRASLDHSNDIDVRGQGSATPESWNWKQVRLLHWHDWNYIKGLMKITRHNFSFAPTVVDGYEVTFRVVQPTESTNPRMRSVCFRVATKLWLLKSGAHRAYYVMHSGQKLRKEDKTNLPLWQKSWERTSEASRRVAVSMAPLPRPSVRLIRVRVAKVCQWWY